MERKVKYNYCSKTRVSISELTYSAEEIYFPEELEKPFNMYDEEMYWVEVEDE